LSGRTAAVRIANVPVKQYPTTPNLPALTDSREARKSTRSGGALDSIRRHWSGKLREAFHRAASTAWSGSEDDADTVNDT
jgi:hypothetical protein